MFSREETNGCGFPSVGGSKEQNEFFVLDFIDCWLVVGDAIHQNAEVELVAVVVGHVCAVSLAALAAFLVAEIVEIVILLWLPFFPISGENTALPQWGGKFFNLMVFVRMSGIGGAAWRWKRGQKAWSGRERERKQAKSKITTTK